MIGLQQELDERVALRKEQKDYEGFRKTGLGNDMRFMRLQSLLNDGQCSFTVGDEGDTR